MTDILSVVVKVASWAEQTVASKGLEKAELRVVCSVCETAVWKVSSTAGLSAALLADEWVVEKAS